MISFYVIKQYERAVVLSSGRSPEARGSGLIFVVPPSSASVAFHCGSSRCRSSPGHHHQGQREHRVSAVAYYRVEDPVRSVVAIESVESGDQSDRPDTMLRAVVGRHTLDETLSETDAINQNIREILDVPDRGVGSQGHGRRAQGHSAAREHAASRSTRTRPSSSPPRS